MMDEDLALWRRLYPRPTLSDPYMYDLDKIRIPPKTFRKRMREKWRDTKGFFNCVSVTPKPLREGFKLLWPYPWHLKVPPPLSVDEIRATPDIIHWRKNYDINYTPLRKVGPFTARDTPLRSLYRLYEAVCAVHQDEIVEESQYFFHLQPKWKLKDIPDPKDPDPVRLAVLASLVEELVRSFNFKIYMGLRRGLTYNKPWLIERFTREPNPPYEEVPEWTSLVRPLPDVVKMKPTIITSPKVFRKRNIFADLNSLWNF